MPDAPIQAPVVDTQRKATLPWRNYFKLLGQALVGGGTGTAGAGAAMAAANALGDDDGVGEIPIPGMRGARGPAGVVGPSGPSRLGAPGFDGDGFDDVHFPIPGPRGFRGTAGAAGASGTVRGRTGAPGIDGIDGEDAFEVVGKRGQPGLRGGVLYAFDVDTDVGIDLAPGTFKFNDSFAFTVTQIAFHPDTFAGTNAATWLDSFDDARRGAPKGLLTIHSARPGGIGLWFFEVSFIGPASVNWIADVVALRPLRCLVLASSRVEPFLIAHPQVMYRMLQAQARRLRAANRWRS